MENVERRVHVVFADNVTPEADANEIHNNDRIENFVLDVDSFIEDFEDEFKVELALETFNGFDNVGDIVMWLESRREVA